MKIFISHSYNEHHQIDVALEKIKVALPEFKEAEVWDPSTNLTAGSNFREEIKQAILSADVYLLLWSKGAANSPWVLYEAGMADASGKHIIIAVEPNSPPLIDAFTRYQIVNLKNES